jgi:hypothetical protein
MRLPRYFIVAELPVKLVSAGLGTVQVFKYNPRTDQFDYGLEYLLKIAAGIDVRELSEEEFNVCIENMRQGYAPNQGRTPFEGT